MKAGLLLINLGTPDASTLSAVKKYLREFLTDRRVIDLPLFIRHILVHCLIIPFRAKKSAHAYKLIWSSEGSPLMYHSQQLTEQVQKALGTKFQVALGMRYGSPSIQSGLEKLKGCESITILPLYPQYSSAANGSAIEKAFHLLKKMEVIPAVKTIPHFYLNPAYINAQTELIKLHLAPDHHLLFSYHGIPERQIKKSGCTNLCANTCPVDFSSNCYKAQCYATSTLIAKALNLSSEQFSTSFQSRLGKTPWIQPYTDEMLLSLAQRGIKKLSITCPSFVADCLETLEEIGQRGKEQWLKFGGEQFSLLPSLNSDPLWVSAIIDMFCNK
jgi:ferrochelatase